MGRIGLIGTNSIEYITLLIEIWNNDDSAVLLDSRTPFQSAIQTMEEADVHKCFVEKGIYEINEEDMYSSIDFFVYEKQSNSAELLPKPLYEKFQNNYSKKEAVVIYSSGTTGKSKGIILSHFAINTNADSISKYMNLNISDCIYIAKPLNHSSTLIGELIVAIKNKGFIFHTPMHINIIGNCIPKLSKVGKNGPHNILGGLATAFSIISLITCDLCLLESYSLSIYLFL